MKMPQAAQAQLAKSTRSTINFQLLLLAFSFISLLTWISFLFAFAKDEGQLPEDAFFANLLADTLYVFRLPLHAIIFDLLQTRTAVSFFFFISLLLNPLLLSMLIERTWFLISKIKTKSAGLRNKLTPILFVLTGLTCFNCVPLQQQMAATEDSRIEGFIGPLINNRNEFNRVVLLHKKFLKDEEFNGETIPMSDCECFRSPAIVDHKLIVTHSYGGGESNRLSTKLYWNGTYHQTANGAYVVDVIMHSDVVDIRRALIITKKIHAIDALQRSDVKTVWINLAGYGQLLKYNY